MNRLQPIIDLSYGEQEVLQRVLAEPQKIADALALGRATRLRGRAAGGPVGKRPGRSATVGRAGRAGAAWSRAGPRLWHEPVAARGT